MGNNAASLDNLTRTAEIRFAGFNVDAGYRTDGSILGLGFINGTVAPTTVDRLTADSVGFSFPGGANAVAPFTSIGPGQTSYVLEIQTNATGLTQPGFGGASDGSTVNFNAFSPGPNVPIVPEPASMLLMGAGLMALAGVRRFAKR